MGPAWYMERQGVELQKNTQVQVAGALAEVEGQPVLLAREVQFDGQVLTPVSRSSEHQGGKTETGRLAATQRGRPLTPTEEP